MKELFNTELFKTEERKEKCKECLYFYVLEYRSGRRYFYCEALRDNRTDNGMLKIKANKTACDLFK